jgi:hypothetical protein
LSFEWDYHLLSHPRQKVVVMSRGIKSEWGDSSVCFFNQNNFA